MALEIQIILIALFAIWLISILNSIYFFSTNVSDSLDVAFHNKSKSFGEARNDLTILENFKKKEFNSARGKVDFYEENCRLTKRKYIYYADKIELGFIKLFLGKSLSKRDVFNKLDLPVKIHFIFILSFCGLIGLGLLSLLIFIAIRHPSFWLIGTFSLSIVIFVRFYIYVVSINCACYYGFLNLILYSINVDRSKLFKNTSILDYLTRNWRGFDHSNIVIGAAAVGSYHSYSGGGFGGFGGGSFGGGGAGGSW